MAIISHYSKETLPLLYMEQNNGLQNTDAGNIQVLSDSAPVLHSLFCWIKIFLLHQRGALNCTSDHSSAAMRILRRIRRIINTLIFHLIIISLV